MAAQSKILPVFRLCDQSDLNIEVVWPMREEYHLVGGEHEGAGGDEQVGGWRAVQGPQAHAAPAARDVAPAGQQDI